MTTMIRTAALGTALVLMLSVVHVLLHHHHDGKAHSDCQVCVVMHLMTSTACAAVFAYADSHVVKRRLVFVTYDCATATLQPPYYSHAPPIAS